MDRPLPPPLPCISTHTLGPHPNSQHTPDGSVGAHNFIVKWGQQMRAMLERTSFLQAWWVWKGPPADAPGLLLPTMPTQRNQLGMASGGNLSSPPDRKDTGWGGVRGTLLGGPALGFQPREERVCGQYLWKLSKAGPAPNRHPAGRWWVPGVWGPEVAALRGSPDNLCGLDTLGGAGLLARILNRDGVGSRGEGPGTGPSLVLDDAVLGQLMQLQVVEGFPWTDDRDVCGKGASVSRRVPWPHHPLGALLSTLSQVLRVQVLGEDTLPRDSE